MDILNIYKQKKINEITMLLNTNISRLNVTLQNNIKTIQRSNVRAIIKQQQINNLTKIYNANVAILKSQTNIAINNIQKFIPQQTTASKNKKALLIGINYTGTSKELYGCINDTLNIKKRLLQNNFKNENITILTDLTNKKATKANILSEFKNLLSNSKSGDLLFFLYSGHGIITLDKNNDELTGYDQCIYPCDLNIIVDDELKNLIQQNLPKDVTLFAMFDACYSGTVLDLRYQYFDDNNYNTYMENTKVSETIGEVFMISGCSDKQVSYDTVINNKPSGAMTWSLLESLKQIPNCSWRELVKNMRSLLITNNYQQTPQFSSGTIENIDSPVFI